MAMKIKQSVRDAAQKKSTAGKMPVKRRINMAVVGEKPINWAIGIPAIGAIVLLAGLLGKVAVVDRYMALTDAQRMASDMQAQAEQAASQVEDYGEMADEYAHYTYSGMTAEELALVDRVEAMDMLERIVMPQATWESISLTDNTAELTITGATLQQINGIVQQLQAEAMVDFCTVASATTEDNSNAMGLVGYTGQVTAHVNVYFANAAEGGDRG